MGYFNCVCFSTFKIFSLEMTMEYIQIFEINASKHSPIPFVKIALKCPFGFPCRNCMSSQNVSTFSSCHVQYLRERERVLGARRNKRRTPDVLGILIDVAEISYEKGKKKKKVLPVQYNFFIRESENFFVEFVKCYQKFLFSRHYWKCLFH